MNESEFKTLFNNNIQFVVEIAYGVIKDWAQAKDIAQEVFTKLWRNREGKTLENINNIQAYLYTITRNTALKHIKHEALVREAEMIHIELNPKIQNRLEPSVGVSYLDAFLQRLSKREKEVFNLVSVQGFSRVDASLELGIAVSTIHEHMKIINKVVKEMLKTI